MQGRFSFLHTDMESHKQPSGPETDVKHTATQLEHFMHTLELIPESTYTQNGLIVFGLEQLSYNQRQDIVEQLTKYLSNTHEPIAADFIFEVKNNRIILGTPQHIKSIKQHQFKNKHNI